uniref:Uncharacterized protein n=1 Tax=Anguilla anguilla TaxID=7936 RepID=A0A0E9SB88_ANGAN
MRTCCYTQFGLRNCLYIVSMQCLGRKCY